MILLQVNYMICLNEQHESQMTYNLEWRDLFLDNKTNSLSLKHQFIVELQNVSVMDTVDGYYKVCLMIITILQGLVDGPWDNIFLSEEGGGDLGDQRALLRLSAELWITEPLQVDIARTLGIWADQEGLAQEALDEYGRLFSKPLTQDHVAALAALFGWAIPENADVADSLLGQSPIIVGLNNKVLGVASWVDVFSVSVHNLLGSAGQVMIVDTFWTILFLSYNILRISLYADDVVLDAILATLVKSRPWAFLDVQVHPNAAALFAASVQSRTVQEAINGSSWIAWQRGGDAPSGNQIIQNIKDDAQRFNSDFHMEVAKIVMHKLVLHFAQQGIATSIGKLLPHQEDNEEEASLFCYFSTIISENRWSLHQLLLD
ncbi:hypothetical protein ACJX0J_039411 [Zea mays]